MVLAVCLKLQACKTLLGSEMICVYWQTLLTEVNARHTIWFYQPMLWRGRMQSHGFLWGKVEVCDLRRKLRRVF